jgi:uncharacterized membrane protein
LDIIEQILEMLALGVEVTAVAVIILGIVNATGHYIVKLLRKQNAIEAFGSYRHGLARTMLLSLEFLVAADIVRTVGVDEPSFWSVGVLGLIIIVRTFLGWTLEVEIDGRWPWQSSKGESQ